MLTNIEIVNLIENILRTYDSEYKSLSKMLGREAEIHANGAIKALTNLLKLIVVGEVSNVN